MNTVSKRRIRIVGDDKDGYPYTYYYAMDCVENAIQIFREEHPNLKLRSVTEEGPITAWEPKLGLGT